MLAIDSQAAPVAALNENLHKLRHGGAKPARQLDLTEFLNEAEVLTFYLEHVARVQNAPSVMQRLNSICDGAFPRFQSRIAAVDRLFIETLHRVRGSVAFRRGYGALDRQCLQQTSVIGFHETLSSPPPGCGILACHPSFGPERSTMLANARLPDWFPSRSGLRKPRRSGISPLHAWQPGRPPQGVVS